MVQIGDLKSNSETIEVVTPKFNKEIYQNVAVWEVDELTLREGEAGAKAPSCDKRLWQEKRVTGGVSGK